MYDSARPTVLKNVEPYAAHVGEEPRRREPPLEHDRRAARQRREHARHQRVAVEQRHRAVEDVVGREAHRHRAAARAARPCVIRTAFGAPVDPT